MSERIAIRGPDERARQQRIAALMATLPKPTRVSRQVRCRNAFLSRFRQFTQMFPDKPRAWRRDMAR